MPDDPTDSPATWRPVSVRLRAFIADVLRGRLRPIADDNDAADVVLKDHVWDDVLAFIRSRGLQSIAFDHARASKSIALSILADAEHAATKLTDDSDSNALAEIESAVSAALRYLAASGTAGPDGRSSYPVAGRIGPAKPDDSGPERAA